nr:MAG TPA: hypothetical protein [Caudoviricetes sp.]
MYHPPFCISPRPPDTISFCPIQKCISQRRKMYHLKIRELRYKITLIQNYRKKVRNSTSARLQEKHTTHTTPQTKHKKRQKEQW